MKHFPENKGTQVAGDNENMLAILHIGSNAAGNLFVTVRGNVNEDSFGTMNGICGICGNLSGGTDAPNLTAQLDKTKFLDRRSTRH